MKPIRFNRGQAISLWGLMASLPVEAHLEIWTIADNPKIMVRAESDLGEAFYWLLPSGGTEPITPPETVAREIVSRDDPVPDTVEP